MLNLRHEDSRGNDIVMRSLTDDPEANMMSLGCAICPQRDDCGGLHVKAALMDCLSLCCGNAANCSRVCPNRPADFVAQRREIGGFDLANVPRVPFRRSAIRTDIVSLIYHGSRRTRPLRAGVVALRLADLIDYPNKRVRYSSREELCAAFQINPACEIILSGVDHDARIEPWWSLQSARADVIRDLATLGIGLVTVPNFSILLDNPRPDDMHAMKRIAIAFAELQEGGLAAALHPNGRTLRDFERWGDFIAARPEIETLSYEFITGAGRLARRQFHLERLAYLAMRAGRPLDIVVRGDPRVIPFLRMHFRSVVYVETTAFLKAQKRRIAQRYVNHALDWDRSPTGPGEPLDVLLQTNVDEQAAYLRSTYYGDIVLQAKAA